MFLISLFFVNSRHYFLDLFNEIEIICKFTVYFTCKLFISKNILKIITNFNPTNLRCLWVPKRLVCCCFFNRKIHRSLFSDSTARNM